MYRSKRMVTWLDGVSINLRGTPTTLFTSLDYCQKEELGWLPKSFMKIMFSGRGSGSSFGRLASEQEAGSGV